MAKVGKRKSAFVYALQVWGTSLLVGPLVWYLIIGGREYSLRDFGYMFIFLSVYGLMYSWPCFLLLWLEVYVIGDQYWRVWKKKFATAFIALLLSYVLMRVVMFLYQAHNDPFFFYVFGAYSVPLVGSVLVYRWPGRGEEGW